MQRAIHESHLQKLRWLHTRQRSACSLKLLSKPSIFQKESANHANQRVSDNWDIFSKLFCTTSRDWSKFAFIPREWGEWQLTGRQVKMQWCRHMSTAPFLLDDGFLRFLPPLERHWVCFQPATEVDRKQNETSWASELQYLPHFLKWHFMSGIFWIFECFQPVRPPSLCNAKRTLGVFA